MRLGSPKVHTFDFFLKELISRHLDRMWKARKDKDPDSEEKSKLLGMRAYLMLLVGTTIFSNKAKNYIVLTYLDYFRHCNTCISISGIDA
jgi:hypothetical protein